MQQIIAGIKGFLVYGRTHVVVIFIVESADDLPPAWHTIKVGPENIQYPMWVDTLSPPLTELPLFKVQRMYGYEEDCVYIANLIADYIEKRKEQNGII